MTFAQLILDARKTQGKDINTVAADAKVSRQTVWLLETGRNRPTLAVALKIIRALGIDPEYLNEVES